MTDRNHSHRTTNQPTTRRREVTSVDTPSKMPNCVPRDGGLGGREFIGGQTIQDATFWIPCQPHLRCAGTHRTGSPLWSSGTRVKKNKAGARGPNGHQTGVPSHLRGSRPGLGTGCCMTHTPSQIRHFLLTPPYEVLTNYAQARGLASRPIGSAYSRHFCGRALLNSSHRMVAFISQSQQYASKASRSS